MQLKDGFDEFGDKPVSYTRQYKRNARVKPDENGSDDSENPSRATYSRRKPVKVPSERVREVLDHRKLPGR